MSESEQLPFLPLRGHALLPGMRLTLVVGRPASIEAIRAAQSAGRLLAVAALRDPAVPEPQAADLYQVGTVARLSQTNALPDRKLEVLVEGLQRCRIDWNGGLTAHADPLPEPDDIDPEVQELARQTLSLAPTWLARQNFSPVSLPALTDTTPPDALADQLAAHLPLKPEERQQILEATSVRGRFHILLSLMQREEQTLKIETEAQQRVKASVEKSQREYFLREQLKLIQEELGQESSHATEAAELRRVVAGRSLPAEVRRRIGAEIDRLERMPPMAGEVALVRNFLELALDLPWDQRTEDGLDVAEAQRLLEQEHYGLEAAKERVLDYLTLCRRRGTVRGPILCLVGPPGVGKTSLARSVAQALGRRFVRIALGGVKDEAEVRGHRRLYMGAQPGRLIQGLRSAQACNPVMLLDEVDKMAADFRGDPSAALLEVLDPEQNHAFRDHFLELPFDLSEVLFIATANELHRIPAPLRDRMEILEVAAYTEQEKVAIARRHLLPRQLAEHRIEPGQLTIEDGALLELVQGYTREAGVRELDRKLAEVCRKSLRLIERDTGAALHITPALLAEVLAAPRRTPLLVPDSPTPGVCLGLSVTDAGGAVMPIEAACMPGQGKLLLTGSLGELMRDSAQAVFSWVRINAGNLGIDPDFYQHMDLHVHIGGGATKNGTSAGVALAVAMVSALTGRRVRLDIAFTGEVSLAGRVLPVGGIREKVLAAGRERLAEVVLPRANSAAVTALPASVQESIRITQVDTVWQALERALLDSAAAVV